MDESMINQKGSRQLLTLVLQHSPGSVFVLQTPSQLFANTSNQDGTNAFLLGG